MIKPIAHFLDLITFKNFRVHREAVKRRANYDFLRAKITERHSAGFNGLTVDFQGHKFDSIDMLSFRPPMYQIAKNQSQHYCIFWDHKKMSEEIGPSFFGAEKPLTTVSSLNLN